MIARNCWISTRAAGRRSSALLLTTLLLSGLNPGLARAAPGGLDEVPADFIQEALAIERAALRLDSARQGSTALTPVYIGSQLTDLYVLEVTLQVDTAKPVRYAYSPAESSALANRGLHELASVAIAPGSHRLYVDYAARRPSDRPGVPRLRSRLVRTIEVGTSPVPLVIEVRPGTLGGEPTLELVASAGDAFGRYLDFLLDSGRYFSAASLILQARERGTGGGTDLERRLQLATAGLRTQAPGDGSVSPVLAQYRAASASMSAGRAADGVPALEALGQQKAISPEAAVLRDQANTALGYHYLASAQPKAAVAAFRRVRSPGPYANTALLGLGWASLAPAGDGKGASQGLSAQAVRTALQAASGDDSRARGLMPFPDLGTVASGERAEGLRRALVPWVELIGRDPTDAAVQEAMLALPYALGHLGAHVQAGQYQERAVSQLERTRSDLLRALEHIASGEMAETIVASDRPENSGWSWWLEDLPAPRWWLSHRDRSPDNFYFERLTEDADFRRHLEIAHQLHELGIAVARRESLARSAGDRALSTRIDALEDRLTAAEANERAALERAATRFVSGLLQQTERYLVEAHFAIARLNDRASPTVAP